MGSDRHKMTSLCHLLQFLAIGVYAIMPRDLVRGILRDRPVARGRVALQVAARRIRPQWIWSRRFDRDAIFKTARPSGAHTT
jgi:hypothetical protein